MAIIRSCLQVEPPLNQDLSKYRHILLDGTYLFQRRGLIAVMEAKSYTVIAGKFGISENSQPSLIIFLTSLKERGLNPYSCTVDGNPHVIRVLHKIWPNLIIQRCLVHIQRQGLMWCRLNPKRTDAKKLRELFLKVPYIRNQFERDTFLNQLRLWEKRYGTLIENTPEHGWVFSDLKRARSMLLKAVPSMFYFLKNKSIPTSTNGLEGYFARLKLRYRQHRGLSSNRLHTYLQWYLKLCSK